MADRVTSQRAAQPVGALSPRAAGGESPVPLGHRPARARQPRRFPGVELDAQGNVTVHDIETQCQSVFRNVRAILEDAGSTWDRLVDVTVFLTDMKNDFPVYNRLWAEYFKDDPPCRTTVEVDALPTPIAIELKCIATMPE